MKSKLERTVLGLRDQFKSLHFAERLPLPLRHPSFSERRQHGSFLNGTWQVSVKTGTDPSLLIKIHN